MARVRSKSVSRSVYFDIRNSVQQYLFYWTSLLPRVLSITFKEVRQSQLYERFQQLLVLEVHACIIFFSRRRKNAENLTPGLSCAQADFAPVRAWLCVKWLAVCPPKHLSYELLLSRIILLCHVWNKHSYRKLCIWTFEDTKNWCIWYYSRSISSFKPRGKFM